MAQQTNEFLNGGLDSPKVPEEPRSSKSAGRSHTLRRVNLTAAINKHVEKVPVRVPNSDVWAIQ